MAEADKSGATGEPSPRGAPEASSLPAWELVEAGRYRPLRIRGSFPGRELG
ncbi:MAG TPA: hypothetical protein VLD61_08270 [Methylomirabilota bacterium]|nr:hypothetical protein [Methylomirabilota bacterium]